MPRPTPPTVVEFLRAMPVFGALPGADIQALAEAASEIACRPREYVFMEGDPSAWFCVVRQGRVRIVRHSRTGKDVVLELLGPGEVFGAVAVIERRPYPANAQATETSAVLRLPAEAVLPLVDRHPSVMREMALTMGRRLRAAHDAVKSLAVEPVEARLAATLLRLARRQGVRGRGGLELPFHLTRQSLADMSGTTVETAIRVVSRWLREGLVEDAGERLVLKDLDALQARAEGGP